MSGNNGDWMAAEMQELRESLPELEMGLQDRIVDSVFRDVEAIIRQWRQRRVQAPAAVCMAESHLKIGRVAVVHGPTGDALKGAHEAMVEALCPGDEDDVHGQ